MIETVSPANWATARASLLAEEKAITRQQQTLAAKRRALPRVKVNDPSQFKFLSSDGFTRTLPDLFEGRKQLIMYEFMPMDGSPDKPSGCPGCSFFADAIPHGQALHHFHAKSVTFCCVAPNDLELVSAYAKRMGWTFPFYAAPGLFKETDASGEIVCWRPEEGSFWFNVFIKEDDGSVYHTYKTWHRGVEAVLGTYALLDMTPLGRREEGKEKEEHSFVRHDEYPEERLNGAK